MYRHGGGPGKRRKRADGGWEFNNEKRTKKVSEGFSEAQMGRDQVCGMVEFGG